MLDLLHLNEHVEKSEKRLKGANTLFLFGEEFALGYGGLLRCLTSFAQSSLCICHERFMMVIT